MTRGRRLGVFSSKNVCHLRNVSIFEKLVYLSSVRICLNIACIVRTPENVCMIMRKRNAYHRRPRSMARRRPVSMVVSENARMARMLQQLGALSIINNGRY